MKPPVRILVLAGTREAQELCSCLAPLDGADVTASLAGATNRRVDYPVPTIIGGFGGADGLAIFLTGERIDLLVDATHPFAERMTSNSVIAARKSGIPLVRLERPPWQSGPADDWHEYPCLEAAVDALPLGSRVFAPLGVSVAIDPTRRVLARKADVEFVLRSVEPMAAGTLPENVVACITGRPGGNWSDEAVLLRSHECTGLLCRNSGGAAGFAKLEAARMLKLPVHLIARPPSRATCPNAHMKGDSASILKWILEFLASKC